MNLIEEGMVIKNIDGEGSLVTEVIKGKYGLLVKLRYHDKDGYEVFCPWELAPPDDHIRRWHGWARYSYISLECGLKLGTVSTFWGECDTIETYDQKIKETWDTIRQEEIARND